METMRATVFHGKDFMVHGREPFGKEEFAAGNKEVSGMEIEGNRLAGRKLTVCDTS